MSAALSASALSLPRFSGSRLSAFRRLALLGLCLLPVACGGPQATQDQTSAYIMPGVPKRAPIKAVPKEQDLTGRPPATVSALLGEPTYIRREQPAEVWQYVTGRCVLDITFYPETDQTRTSKWIESRDMGGRRMAVPDCLNSFGSSAI